VAIRRVPSPAGGQGQSGQAIAEFALVAPILFFLIIAIFQFAFVLEAQIGLTNAVREAARRAAAAPATDSTTLSSFVLSQLNGSTGLLASNVQGFQSSKVASGSPSVALCQYTVGSVTSDRLTVGVTYGYPIFFPLLSYATDAVDGTTDGAWTLTATAQMRLESNVTDATPPGACP